MYKRAESLFNERTKRGLADMVVHRESDIEDLRNLVRDALACVRESSRGFQTHPKTYRDLRSRAKKLGVVE
jgi:predicted component of type VI protein secretion system